ncbi:MAG: molybdate ABC transporter substrate-binding protein [Steroidobacteraceae bacterium]
MGKIIGILASILCVPWLAPTSAAAADKPSITVFAAASLTNVLQELGDGFTKTTSVPVRFSFAASSALARQIENGSPADVFFSADLEWMDYLQARNLIQPDSRHNVIGNRLVLVAPTGSKIKLKIEPGFALAAALGKGRLATGDPDAVPVGRYAREALTTLGVWSNVADRLVRADSVRSALAFVDRGEAPLGIVYDTDALIDRHVRVVDVFPDNSHLPIVCAVALTSRAGSDPAKFVDYVRGPAGQVAFKAHGFTPLR